MFRSIAETDLANLARPREIGERVNSNVSRAVPEPRPDYEAMRRLLEDPTAAKKIDIEKAASFAR